MLNAVICDDQEEIVRNIKKMFSDTEFGVEFNITSFNTAKGLIDHVFNNQTDIVITDIELSTNPEINKKENGAILGKKIKEYDKNILTIFISQYEGYTTQLLETELFRFVNKQKYFEKNLKEAISAAVDRKIERIYTIKTNGGIMPVDTNDILYFSSLRKQICIKFKNGDEEIFYKRLDELEKELKETSPESARHFLRIHQSYYINLNFVKNFKSNSVLMKNYEQINVGEKYLEAYKTWITLNYK